VIRINAPQRQFRALGIAVKARNLGRLRSFRVRTLGPSSFVQASQAQGLDLRSREILYQFFHFATWKTSSQKTMKIFYYLLGLGVLGISWSFLFPLPAILKIIIASIFIVSIPPILVLLSLGMDICCV